ncbi:DHH family phosphoesterase [Halorhabdus rudnickae]|uniref:DHH family phosphoesterase n=1 Tax=Halorhabdus rudnickae TaxID=1775544 RepID=UPI0010828B55|nr:DHH family phosphoesterase [Halorhabdus rudnickae]
MHTRLVAGCGSLGETLVGTLAERPGRTVVVREAEAEYGQVETSAIEVIEGDPSDPEILGAVDGVETVIVSGEDPSRNLAVARATREVYPSAFLLAYIGSEASADTRAALGELADRIVDPRAALASYLTDRVGTGGNSIHALQSVLRDIEGELAIMTHDNPDPDAIASALALERIADRLGCPAQVCYYGSINHQENQAMVNLLEYDLRKLEPAEDLSAFGGFALVDHARPGVNDGLPEETDIDVVIDHHPPRGPVAARFTDLRSDVGATSTLLVDYYRRLGIEPAEDIATGLLFGIRVDTDEFSREVSVADFEAGAFLLPHADVGALERIENPNVSSATLETIAEAIVSRERYGSVLLSGVGQITDRDTLAQAADRLLNLEAVTTTLVYGIKEGTIYVSARARGTDLDLGEALRAAFDQVGSAGGHADMAGAQIKLGVMEWVEEGEQSLREVVDGLVTDRFLEVLEMHPSQISLGTYGTGADTADSLSNSLSMESPGTPTDDGLSRDNPDNETSEDTGERGRWIGDDEPD